MDEPFSGANSSQNKLVVLSKTTGASYKLWIPLCTALVVTQFHEKTLFYLYSVFFFGYNLPTFHSYLESLWKA